jgi:4-amino-4-deoxy-L-arabinose transferase-like glycosyltransferase
MPVRRAVPILVLVTLVTCWVFELRGRVPFSSDQAVVAIMAEDILARGAHPVFYYGAEYAGTLEPHYLALVFAIFGASPLVFRGAMAILVVLAGLGAWATAREAFGDRAGFFAGLYLALGPSFFLYKGLTSDGAYTSLLVLSSLCLWLMLVVERRFIESQPATVPLLGLGLALGLSWWVHTPSVFLGAVTAAAALAGATRRWLSPRSLGLLLSSFLVGSAPWWIRNFQTGMGSLRAAEMSSADATRFGPQAKALFLDGWSIILGARSAWSEGPALPGAGLLALGLLLVLLGFGLWSALRGPSHPARYGATLCLTAVLSLSVLCLLVSRTDFREPRYLFAGYAAVAPLVGGLVAAVWSRRIILAALAAALLGLNLGSVARAPSMKHNDPLRATAAEYDLRPVLDRLRAEGVRGLYTSYWIAYRLTFMARGEVVASPLGRGPHGAVRIARLKAEVGEDPDPGFLLFGTDREDMRDYLSTHGIVPRRAAFAGFALFRDLPHEALVVIRRCNCIPTTLRPGEVAVVSAEGPERVRAGGVARFQVAVRNDSPRPLSDNVHLSYHWIRADGTMADWDGERALTSGWPQGPPTTAEIRVPVRVPPGEYQLVFELVDENVAWLEGLGARTARRRILVEPSGT